VLGVLGVRGVRLGVVAAFGAVGVVVLAAQQKAPQPVDKTRGQPTFRSGVDLVDVDIVVVDKDGAPVRGLKQSDFTVMDRGKPQTIATFQEVENESKEMAPPSLLSRVVRLDVSNNQTSQAGRLIVMVVDDLHIYKDRTDKAKEIARNVLTQLGPASSMAVLFTSGEHSTQVTSDQTRLTAAVDTLKGRQSVRRPHPAIDKQHGDRVDPEMSAAQQIATISANNDTSVQDFVENMTQYQTLRDAARLLGGGGDARRKAFVLISEGIGKDLHGIFGAMTPQGNVPEGGLEYATTGDPAATMKPDIPPYHEMALLDMMESMRRSNVATYAIDPRGKVDSKDLSKECFPPPRAGNTDPCVGDSSGLIDWVSPVRQAQHGLEIMSEASGGFAVTNTDDFTSGLKKIVDDLDHYYLIGFYPSDAKGKGYRPLGVRVEGHPEWTLRYRRGYMPGGPPPPPKNTDPLVSLSAGILPKSDLPLRLGAVTTPAANGLAHVTLALEVSAPREQLQEPDGRVRDTLKYEVLIVDEKKAKVRSVGGLEGRLTLSPKAPGQTPPAIVSYQVTHTLDVPPGRFEVRVSALSGKLAKGGSVYLDVDVPDFRAAAPALGEMAVGYADGPHVPVAPGAGPVTAMPGRGAPPPASATAALPFPPSLDRVFTPGDTLAVYLEGTARSSTGLIASLDVVDAAGKVVRSQSPSFSSADPIRLRATVPLDGLTPGAYLLRATLTSAGRSVGRESGFAIR
jgi:VWFA-related protein